jgi:hypothetical protein
VVDEPDDGELGVRLGCAAEGLRITVLGVVDSSTAPLLAGILREATAEPRIPVVVDLCRTTFLAVGGAAMIDAARSALMITAQPLLVRNAHGSVRRALIARGMQDALAEDDPRS